MNDIISPWFNGADGLGVVIMITALFYWALPAETINIIRGIGELLGRKERP